MLTASSNIILCRYLHQVTACTLYLMRKRAYNQFKATSEEDLTESEWIAKCEKSPMFKYWNLTLKLELALLEFVRSIRSGDFNAYVEALLEIAPWMFALNHHNYTRWLPIHIRCMINLDNDTKYQFLDGRFAVQKTNRKFSKIALDHNHEQLNRKIKGVGGAIGLTENDTSLRRWVVTGPEIARLLDEFENTGKIHTVEEIEEHQDSNAASQVKFQQDVNQLEKAFTELGNPFVDNSKDLISLGTNIVMDESNTENLFKVEAAGQQQFKDYWESRIIHHKIPVSNTITKNKFHIFTKPKKDLSKTQKQLKSMKNNVGLFSRLFIACQTRNGDLDTFFCS